MTCTDHRTHRIHGKVLPLEKVKALSGQCFTHSGFPSQRSHLWIRPFAGFTRGAASGHAMAHRPQSTQALGSIRTIPSSPFRIALVGHTSMHTGSRQCWQKTAKAFPFSSSLITRMLAEAGDRNAPSRAEQIISQVRHPVHFWGSKIREGDLPRLIRPNRERRLAGDGDSWSSFGRRTASKSSSQAFLRR
jgi:hypothetical protein